MSPVLWTVIGLVVVFDLLLLPLILRVAFQSSLGALAAKYPAVEPRAECVRRNFQSFSFGMVNLGMGVHVAVDEDYLHLLPVKLVRLFGVQGASVPWDAIELRDGRVRQRGFVSARIGGQSVMGPRWCLEIARAAAKPDEGV
jgi:hypothetical protein